MASCDGGYHYDCVFIVGLDVQMAVCGHDAVPTIVHALVMVAIVIMVFLLLLMLLQWTWSLS
jgi:multisubunit Na+/H+ antiporter MnhC subunit